MGQNENCRKAPAANPPAASQTVPGEKKVSRFIVGLDFGTTYTSVAFAHSESPTEIKMVQTWPSGATGNNSANQVPTKLEYTGAEMTWGYEVLDEANDPSSKPLKWFKLLLQDRDAPSSVSKNRMGTTAWQLEVESRQSPLSEVNELFRGLGISPWVTPEQKTRKIMGELGITRVQLVADFLKKIKETTLKDINRTYWMQSKVGSKVEWVLTVPAIWKDAAKNLMSQAAKQAGFGQKGVDFKLISEPECGATYVLKAIQPNYLSIGDVFLLCDAGGGTVDLISYKITGITPLRVDMVVAGSGDLCGSVFLDRRFEEYMRRTLGDETIDAMKPRSKEGMMRSWEETVKFKFGNEISYGTFEVFAPGVPDNEEMNVEDGYHSMRFEDVQGIFDPVIHRIIELVSQQVSGVKQKGERVKAILLVGGFGSSEYLMTRLKDHFSVDGIEVLQPVNARSAIARGALLRGFDGSIVMARRAPRYYGSTFASTNATSPEVQGHTYVCAQSKMLKVPEKMNWYVKKGALIQPADADFYRLVSIKPGIEPDLVFHTTMYACDEDVAPTYKWQNPAAVYYVCTLTTDLSDIPRSEFQMFTNVRGERFYRVIFKLRMTLSHEVWRFELIFKGKRYGLAETRFT